MSIFLTLLCCRFRLKLDYKHYVVLLKDAQSDSICSVQIEVASVKCGPAGFSSWSRAARRFWDAAEACCGAAGGNTSVV